MKLRDHASAHKSDIAILSRHLLTTASMLEPPPTRTADEWADDHRILPPDAPEPGPWRTSRVPYTPAIYKAIQDPRYTMVVIVMGSQMSKTELLLNIIGHRFSDGPYVPALYIAPTQKLAQSMSGDRIDKLFRSTPVLWNRLEKGQRNKTFEKFIAGVRFGLGWAGSTTELASHPAGLVLVDERDRMDSDIGSEGDPVELARARIDNYTGGTAVIASTPTLEGGSPIMFLFDEGTKMIYCWPCPHCNDYFRPRLSLLKWPEGADAGQALREAYIVCPSCGSIIDDTYKNQMNRDGMFIPHKKADDGDDYIKAEKMPDLPTASFWVSGLCSPWRSFGQTASRLVAAYQSRENERIQAVVNTAGGEPYRTQGSRPEWSEVMECRLPYKRLTIPSGVQMITAGVDVQKRGLYFVIRGWGYGIESWKLDNGYIEGETEYDNPWIILGRRLQAQIGDRVIDRMFVDSGYRPGDIHRRPENVIYSFCRRHSAQAFPAKGHDTQDQPIKASSIDIDYQGATIKNGLRLFHFNSDFFKSWVHARVKWPKGEIGAWHIDSDTDETYCRHIISEEVVVKPSGRRVWIVKDRNNHYLDCEALATAAAYSLHVEVLPQLDQPTAETKTTPPASPGKETFIKRPPGSFIRR